MKVTPKDSISRFQDMLKAKGFRSTKQRLSVYKVLLEKKDHPTADDIFFRVKEILPTISFATVYNCLETFVDCGVLNKINFDQSSSRYCPNLSPHAHFKCTNSGKIFDLPLSPQTLEEIKSVLPQGFDHSSFDLSFQGTTIVNN